MYIEDIYINDVLWGNVGKVGLAFPLTVGIAGIAGSYYHASQLLACIIWFIKLNAAVDNWKRNTGLQIDLFSVLSWPDP